jgi:GT2 family glycosyltransferase
MSSCTILILTYKGKHHLEFLLPTLQETIGSYQGQSDIRVLILDNGCDEITKNYVRSSYPQFSYQFSRANDFLFSLNDEIKNMDSDFILLLNDDLKLDRDLLNQLLPMMEKGDNSIFAISCRIMNWEGNLTSSAVRMAAYEKGWMKNYYLDHSERQTKYTLFASGGSSLLRTRYFNLLGGFDTLFRPAYSEDVDLGIRAWQMGWKVVYQPKAFVYHREGGSTKNYFENDELEKVIYKNEVLCMIKNTRVAGFLFWFFLLLPYRLIYNYIYHRNYYKGMVRAIGKLSLALAKRKKIEVSVKDEDWMGLLNQPYIEPSL